MEIAALKTPFRWYEDEADRIINNETCLGYLYKLITPFDRLLPFMIRFVKDAIPQVPISLKIYSSETGALIADVANGLQYIEYYTYGDYDYLVYKGNFLNINLDSGYYYAQIVLNDTYKTFTSETFYVDCEDDGRIVEGSFSGDFNDDFSDDYGPLLFVGGMRKYSKIEWWSDCDLGDILYQTGYHNVLYLDVDIIRDEPEYLEEGVENGEKDFIPTFIKYIDKLKYNDYVPDFIINALMLIKLHKACVITTKKNLYTTSAKEFICSFNAANSCYYLAECSFKHEVTYLKANCCQNNTITNQYACGIQISPVSVSYDGSGNFILNWSLLAGSNPTFQIISPSISGGAPAETALTTYASGPYSPGTIITGIVRGKCTNPINNVVTYGNEQSFTATIPCPVPSGLGVDSITNNSANLFWDNIVGGKWEVVIFQADTPGVPLPGYPKIVTTNSEPVTGLSAGTAYNWSVRRYAGDNPCSAYVDMVADPDFETLP